jgi:LDH2 family malate/lactate/ureidoglycolate dehydrogenase
MPSEDASIVADSMIWTGLRGKPMHSVIRLVQVASRARAGGLRLQNDWTPVAEVAGTTLLNARGAWGVIAGIRGMRLAVDKARTHGVGLTVARDCDNTGALGTYPAMALGERMIGLAITNSMPLIPAWGGSQKLLGNQAFGIGAPACRHSPCCSIWLAPRPRWARSELMLHPGLHSRLVWR